MSSTSPAFNPIHKAIGFCIILAALTGASYFAIVHVPRATVDTTVEGGHKGYDLFKRIAKDFDRVFHFVPRVTENDKEVIVETKPIAEFTPVQREFDHTYTWTHSWYRSTKSITMKARFVVKAGYDLSKPFSIDISRDQKVVRTQLPPAKINSCTGTKYETVKEDNGWWNGITKEERDAVINELNARAQQSAIDNGILKEADKHLEAQIEEIIRNAVPSASIAQQPLS